MPAPHAALSLSVEQLAAIPALYTRLVNLLAAQLAWLPEGFFAHDLPEAEAFIVQALQDLDVGLRSVQGQAGWAQAVGNWSAVKNLAKEKFGWEVGADVTGRPGLDGEEEEEDEEDRPVVVEM